MSTNVDNHSSSSNNGTMTHYSTVQYCKFVRTIVLEDSMGRKLLEMVCEVTSHTDEWVLLDWQLKKIPFEIKIYVLFRVAVRIT